MCPPSRARTKEKTDMKGEKELERWAAVNRKIIDHYQKLTDRHVPVSVFRAAENIDVSKPMTPEQERVIRDKQEVMRRWNKIMKVRSRRISWMRDIRIAIIGRALKPGMKTTMAEISQYIDPKFRESKTAAWRLIHDITEIMGWYLEQSTVKDEIRFRANKKKRSDETVVTVHTIDGRTLPLTVKAVLPHSHPSFDQIDDEGEAACVAIGTRMECWKE